MKPTKKIAAFTLTEVMVTMAVSSVVVLLSYMTFTMIGNYFQQVYTSNNRYNEWLSARLFLSDDILRADSLIFEEAVLQVHGPGAPALWFVAGDTLVRQQQHLKKFHLGSFTLNAYPEPGSRLVNRVIVSRGGSEQDSTHFRFYKTYPIAVQINP